MSPPCECRRTRQVDESQHVQVYTYSIVRKYLHNYSNAVETSLSYQGIFITSRFPALGWDCSMKLGGLSFDNRAVCLCRL